MFNFIKRKKSFQALPLKPYIIFALPLILNNLIGDLIQLVDLSLGSILEHENASIIGYFSRIYFVFGAFIIASNSSMSMHINPLLAAKRLLQARSYFLSCLMINTVIGLTFLFICSFFPHVLLFALKDQDMVRLGTQYAPILGLNTLIVCMTTPFSLLLISQRRSKPILFYSTLSSLTNIVASYFLAFTLNLGIIGIGLGSTISIAFYGCGIFSRVKKHAPFPLLLKGFNLNKIPALLKNIIDIFLASLAPHFTNLVIVTLFAEVSAFMFFWTLFLSYTTIFQGIFLGLGSATAVEIGKAIGSERSLIKDKTKALLHYNIFAGIMSSLLCCFFLSLQIFLFNQNLVPAWVFIPVTLNIFFVASSANLAKGILRSGGDIKFLRNTNLTCHLLFKLLPILLLRLMGIKDNDLLYSTLFVITTADGIRYFLILFRIKSFKWVHYKLAKS